MNLDDLKREAISAFVLDKPIDQEDRVRRVTIEDTIMFLHSQGRIVPDGYVAVPLDALRDLTPFEIVGGDSIKRTNPHSNVNLNSSCHWAVSNGDKPAYKLRDAIAKLNAAAQKVKP